MARPPSGVVTPVAIEGKLDVRWVVRDERPNRLGGPDGPDVPDDAATCLACISCRTNPDDAEKPRPRPRRRKKGRRRRRSDAAR